MTVSSPDEETDAVIRTRERLLKEIACIEELTAMLLSRTDYRDPDLGPQLLAIQVRERGRSHLVGLIGPKILTDIDGHPVIARHSSVEGMAPAELYTWIVGARKGLAQYWQRWETILPPTMPAA